MPSDTKSSRCRVNPVIWLTGQTGAGKTTLANRLEKQLNAVVLDGDEMRESISRDLTLSPEDRKTHNMRVTRLAKTLSHRRTVIVAVIAPFEETRSLISEELHPVWVYVRRRLPTAADKPYEPPVQPHITVDSDLNTAMENADKVLKYLAKEWPMRFPEARTWLSWQ